MNQENKLKELVAKTFGKAASNSREIIDLYRDCLHMAVDEHTAPLQARIAELEQMVSNAHSVGIQQESEIKQLKAEIHTLKGDGNK